MNRETRTPLRILPTLSGVRLTGEYRYFIAVRAPSWIPAVRDR